MSTDIKIDLADIDIETIDGDIVLVDDDYEIPQSCQIRLLTIAGEQFDNTAVGIPWMYLMSDSGVGDAVKRALLVREILQTPGVKKLDDFKMDKNDSSMTVGFTISIGSRDFDLEVVRA